MGWNNKVLRAKQAAKAILDSNSLAEAYKKTHPKSSDASAKKNSGRLLKMEHIDGELERRLKDGKKFEVTKDNLVKILHNLMDIFYTEFSTGVALKDRTVKASDMIRMVEALSQLVPEFVSRTEIQAYSHMSDKELDESLKMKMDMYRKNLN